MRRISTCPAITGGWTQAQVQLRHLDISPREADLFQRLAGHLLFAGPALRPASEAIRRGAGAQSELCAHGISGDLPILLLRIDDIRGLELARQMLLAHEYLCLKQFAVDLVILNEHAASYSQELRDALEALVRAQPKAPSSGNGGRGSVHLLRTDVVPQPTTALLAVVARVVLVANRGHLAEQLDRAEPDAPADGRGYSRFERTTNGIASSLLQYVPLDEPVKISRLRLRNTTNRRRSISVCAYVERVLGAARDSTAAFVTPSTTASPARCSPATPGARRSAPRSPSPISAARRPVGQATGAQSSVATACWPSRMRCATAAPCPARHRRRRPGPLRRASDHRAPAAGWPGGDRPVPRRGR